MGQNRQRLVPTWLKEVDPQINQKINTILNQYKVDNETAKKIADDYFRVVPCVKRDFDAGMLQVDIENSFAIKVNRKTHNEKREIEKHVSAFNNQTERLEGEIEDIWEKRPSKYFEKRNTSWIRGGSAIVSSCGYCNGHGILTCSTCDGKGRYFVKCNKCSGKGVIQSNCPNCSGSGRIFKKATVPFGFDTYEQCIRCSASSKLTEVCMKCDGQCQIIESCKECIGEGVLGCKECERSGQMYHYETINAVAKPTKQSFYICTFGEIKNAWFKYGSEYDNYFIIEDPINIENLEITTPDFGRILKEKYNFIILPVSRITLKNNEKYAILFVIGKTKKIIGKYVISFCFDYLDYRVVTYYIIILFLITSIIICCLTLIR